VVYRVALGSKLLPIALVLQPNLRPGHPSHMSEPRPNFVGIRRPKVLGLQGAQEASTEWGGLKESSYRSSVREASKVSLRERSLGSQENWPTSLQGSYTYRDWNPCERLEHGDISHTTIPQTARGAESGMQNEGSFRLKNSTSFLARTQNQTPLHTLSPMRSPSTYSAPKFLPRAGVWRATKNERGLPHTLGRPYTSVGAERRHPHALPCFARKS
jgi:hypothetical protein